LNFIKLPQSTHNHIHTHASHAHIHFGTGNATGNQCGTLEQARLLPETVYTDRLWNWGTKYTPHIFVAHFALNKLCHLLQQTTINWAWL